MRWPARLTLTAISALMISACSPRVIDTSCSSYRELRFGEATKAVMALEEKRMVDAHNRKWRCFCLGKDC